MGLAVRILTLSYLALDGVRQIRILPKQTLHYVPQYVNDHCVLCQY